MTRQALPKSISLDLDDVSFGGGLTGLVRAVAASMRFQGEELSDEELLGISSAAFCNYVFDPEFNQHEDPPRAFSRLASYFSNYGPWESMSYYTGWQIREVSHLKGTELMKLIAFELAGGRPIVTLDAELQPRLVSSYSISVEERTMTTADGTTYDIADEELQLQGDDEVFHNWLLLVRPGESEEWAASRDRQRVNVLRWAVEHGANTKEFFQETRENYAPGLAGFASFRRFLDGLTDPEGVAYAEQYVAQLAQSRAAAATVLADWSEDVAAELGESDVADILREAAGHFAKVAEALGDADNFSDAVALAEEAESEAQRTLQRAAVSFPGPFEA